jgi:hypothetical protein
MEVRFKIVQNSKLLNQLTDRICDMDKEPLQIGNVFHLAVVFQYCAQSFLQIYKTMRDIFEIKWSSTEDFLLACPINLVESTLITTILKKHEKIKY